MVAGAHLQIGLLPKLGLIGLAYIVNRVVGKSLGTWIGGKISDAQETVGKYLGFCLLARGGVAIGLSLQAFNDFRTFGPDGRTLGFWP